MRSDKDPVTAILGPTNTGKTHLAVERMCAHSSGIMGFPLRLLAREIYDRVVAIKGAHRVALITGEERIEPPRACWYLCTAESMPLVGDRDFAFVAIDEAQLAADRERGHVFTDRILHARGREETMLLGSATLRPVLRALLPEAEIVTRPRFSTLSHAGSKKLSRVPPRSAIVAFSIEEVYAVAEMLRRLRGGAAVVTGALSPRTRNAQVAMFQSGEVDYLVATDAIGMGLNLDVAHVAFASLSKFDGQRQRRLTRAEMAQIAGRAGRHQRDGSFGTVAGAGAELTCDEIEAIENHRFAPLEQIYWREGDPRFDDLDTLIADLDARPTGPLINGRPMLISAPEATDLAVLRRLADDASVRATVNNAAGVARLWAAASLPDFRQTGAEHHARFVNQLWGHLGHGDGRLPHAWVATQIAALDNVQGDIGALSGRIASARTWAYIAQRADWLTGHEEMAARTSALEQRLSDALHDGLRQRFVDRRASVLMRRNAPDRRSPGVTLADDGAVAVDGEEIGRLDGFAFSVASGARMTESRMILAAAEKYLGGIMSDQARKLADAGDGEFRLGSDAGGHPSVFWNDAPLCTLVAGATLIQPRLRPHKALGGLEGDDLKAVVGRAEDWIRAQLARHLGGVTGLLTLSQGRAVPPPVRAIAVQLAQSGGIAGRQWLGDAVHALDKDQRATLRKAGVTFGALDVFHHQAVKPGATAWRLALVAAQDGTATVPPPPDSAVHLADWTFADAAACRNAGFRPAGREYLRIDMAEKLVRKAHDARAAATGRRDFAFDMALATSLGLSEAGLERLLIDAGFRRVKAPAVVALAAASGRAEAASEYAGAGQVEHRVGLQPVSAPDQATADPPEDETAPDAVPADDSGAGSATTEHAIGPVEAAVRPPSLMHLRWVGLKSPPRHEPGPPQAATDMAAKLAALTARF